MYLKYDIYLHLHHSSQTTSLLQILLLQEFLEREREVQFFSSILPAQLKADSEDTVLTGIVKKSLAIRAKIG